MYSLFRGKRGSETIEMAMIPAFALVIVFGVIFFGLLSFFEEIRNHTLFEKIFLKKDLAILIDTIYSAPGNVELNYPKDTHAFTFTFTNSKIEVYDPNTILHKQTHPIINDRNISFQETTLEPTFEEDELKEKVQIKITKLGNKMSITDFNTQITPFTFVCPEIENAETVQGKSLYIPPLVTKEHLDSPDIITSSKDAFISLIKFTSNFDENNNNLVAYISSSSAKSLESERVACLILNEIITNTDLNTIMDDNSLKEITGITIIPTSEYGALNQDNIAVILQIGNQRIGESQNLLENEEAMLAISSSINKGIEQYDD